MSGILGPRRAEARAELEALLDLPEPEAEARLARIGERDSELADIVGVLWRADREAGAFLEGGVAEFAPGLGADVGEEGASGEDLSGRRIGPYRLLSLLGRGGMGEVYLAERTDGEYQKTVALKLVRPGRDSDAIRRRFLRERQLLARLEHPNIARLLDGGTSEGRPYFVLERVEGIPITDYCRERGLPIEERLRLMIACCDAVDAAHRRLTVHRDLKPSNILVTAEGDVKLLDFGIAKALEEDEDESRLTRADERALTPAYAAPEQILSEPVTTATDVYALGVVLYELLTGRLPHDRRTTSAADLVVRLQHETIEKPSRALEKGGPEALAAAGIPERNRRRGSTKLAGDLDAIVLQALRREPERRYPSAAALAEDLRRYLEGRPIAARPDTFRYRAGKFVRRHRVGVLATAMAILAVIGGLAGTTWQARRAAASAREALAQARRADRVKEFLIGLFEVADPEQAGGGNVTAKDLIEQSGRRLETDLARDPEIQADLLDAVARIDRSLGLLDPARALAEKSLAIRRKSLPADDPGIGESLATVGSALMGQGKLDEAEKTLSRALAILEKNGARAPLAAARVRSDLSQAMFWRGKSEQAEVLERRVYETYRRELGDQNVLTAVHQRNLCVLLDELDRIDEAEKACRASQAILERQLGPDHPNLAESYLNLATIVDIRRNRPAEAEPLYVRALEIRKRKLGPAHPSVGQALQLYALFLLNQGRLDESEARYREALALFRGIDPKHFEIGKCENGLALIAARRGDYRQAEQILGGVVALFREVLGEKHPFVWQAIGNRADQVASQGRLAEAETQWREVVSKLQSITGAESPEAADAMGQLAETLRREGRASEAVPLGRKALEIQKRVNGPEHLDVAVASLRLGSSLADLPGAGARSEAFAHLDRAAAIYRKLKPDHPRFAEVLLARGKLAARTGSPASARRDLTEAAELAAKKLGAGDRRTREARAELAQLRQMSAESAD